MVAQNVVHIRNIYSAIGGNILADVSISTSLQLTPPCIQHTGILFWALHFLVYRPLEFDSENWNFIA